ncbi:MAG: NAD-glutamate dehydrogenase [Gammaproteobacteria bacterium]|nr:NAD-glutamate dehydrogenase [Gammaproteobacteria bacterium]
MSSKHHLRTQEIIDEIVALIDKKVDTNQRDLLEKFARQYYLNCSADDLAEIEINDLYGAVMSHWNNVRVRQPGTTHVRIYNPQYEKHGWQSTHTIVEIVIDDMPFLVDSVRMALNARSLTTHIFIHPVINIQRDQQGRIVDILDPRQQAEDARLEAIMLVQVDRQTEKSLLDDLTKNVKSTLKKVSLAVADWRPMCQQLDQIIDQLKTNPPPIDKQEIEHSLAFLEWVADNNFTFLGYREYHLLDTDELESVADSGFGLLRSGKQKSSSKSFSNLPREVRRMARQPELLVITKSSQRSQIHRPGLLDMIGIKKFNEQGEVIGELRFLGLYTSAAYNNPPSEIPILREKMAYVIDQSGYPPNSHAAKALQNIIETFPRDLLFQVSNTELLESSTGILHLQERQRIRLFVHPDRFHRYYSCMVFVPRDRFDTATRLKIQHILVQYFGGVDSEFNILLSESVLARIYFVIHVPPGSLIEYDIADLEQQLKEATRSWSDDLHDALIEGFGEEQGMRLFRRYGDAFKAEYCEQYTVRTAVEDIRHMEDLDDGDPALAMSLYRPLEAPESLVRFKLFNLNKPVSLSDALPMLENMGLRVEEEHPSRILRSDAPFVWLHDFSMSFQGDWKIDLDDIRDKFQDAFLQVWCGNIENDGLNRLVFRAGLDWREIVVLRAYSRYLHQAGTPFSHEYIERALSFNHKITAMLIDLFHTRFDPKIKNRSQNTFSKKFKAIESALDDVISLDEDRILRSFLSMIEATLRTNHYQLDAGGNPKSYLSFKFDPSKVPDLPEPRPMFEIFVYSTRVEGVHLRGGPVARGGLRWSDRREDFRTEVLGLVKAQMVKNAVIVPVGSKGGFYPKQLPITADREAIQAEGIACYQTFIRGLLDLTDNLVGGKIVNPERLVRYDGDDPYLVVAADKGTATFSDIANAISADYGFWLGDAFASGGSQGYDHKAMGITARGAWESVKRHFSELGLNTQAEAFSVIGIGDMAGDVFGNGMLLSPFIKLVGAFNHMHIFLDPDPDPATSFNERKRMFELPRSTWEDYAKDLISRGGGVYARSEKAIELTPEVQKLLGVNRQKMTPNELIRAMLCAPIDLIWNGGIGTYVKSSKEHHGDVGDRSNDALRVNATDLRCQVFGEGGNLGVTQLGRIEFAAGGGRINTDAIDNSAGVDCSDHEVNIKILLNEVVENQDMTEKQRNKQLAAMTDEVAELVLRDNYLQTQTLSISTAQAPQMLDVHSRLIRSLEHVGILDPEIEFLPDKDEIDERMLAGQGLTSPELSVLLAYVKNHLFQELLNSELPDDAFYANLLIDYFPLPLRKKFSQLMPKHRLQREIISTEIANDLGNRVGITFIFRMQEETGANSESIARAYTIARKIFSMPELWAEIEALDNQVPATAQMAMLLEGRKLVERATRWLLRNRSQPIDIAANVAYFTPGIESLAGILPSLLRQDAVDKFEQKVNTYLEQEVPEKLARKIAFLGEKLSSLDIVEVSNMLNLSDREVASVYYAVGEKLDFSWLREQATQLPRSNRWQALSRAALRHDVYNQHRVLTREVLTQIDKKAEAELRVDEWIDRNSDKIQRSRQILADLKSAGKSDFNMLSVAMQEIRSLISLKGQADSGASAKPKVSAKKASRKSR